MSNQKILVLGMTTVLLLVFSSLNGQKALAQTPNLNGNWSLEANITVNPPPGYDCQFLTAIGDPVIPVSHNGTGWGSLYSHDTDPNGMEFTLQGEVNGNFVNFDITGFGITPGDGNCALGSYGFWTQYKEGYFDPTTKTISGNVLGIANYYFGDDPATGLPIWYPVSWTGTFVVEITHMNEPPVASFTYSPESPLVGQDITFDGSSSYDPDGTIVKYEWDFGNGDTGDGATANYAYDMGGEYKVRLTVTDNDGLTGFDEKTISFLLKCEVPDDERTRLGFPTQELDCPPRSCIRRETLPGTRSDGPTGVPCLVDETIQDTRGVSFEVWCADWVAPICNKCFGFFRKDGGRSLAGKCWFEGGVNEVSIEYSSQNVQADGTPECFISSRWDNFQVNRNEPDPPLPDQPPGPLSGGRYPPDGKLDTWTYVHHVPTTKTDISVSVDLVEVFHRDPTSGPGFNDLPPVLGDLPDSDLTKKVLPAQKTLCDLNRDGRCDGVDFSLFHNALGSCRGDPSYNVLADANLDGCITPGDEQVLFLAIPVTIDIKPGSDPNSINPKSKGKIPVAILSTEEFDAPTQVVQDQDSLTFGRTGKEKSLAFCNPQAEDVNGDGRLDLVCHFYTEHVAFECDDTEGILNGMMMDGIPIQGSDSVRIIPCK